MSAKTTKTILAIKKEMVKSFGILFPLIKRIKTTISETIKKISAIFIINFIS
jgi:hypothetical protein